MEIMGGRRRIDMTHVANRKGITTARVLCESERRG